jgi:hypothetical protein
LASSTPDFEAKAADVIGLYLREQPTAVFCVDEKIGKRFPVLAIQVIYSATN